MQNPFGKFRDVIDSPATRFACAAMPPEPSPVSCLADDDPINEALSSLTAAIYSMDDSDVLFPDVMVQGTSRGSFRHIEGISLDMIYSLF